jgi:hypothetical protein
MDRIRLANIESLSDIDAVAVAIRLHRDGSRHLGILIRYKPDEEAKILHLAQHKKLLLEKPSQFYFQIDPLVAPKKLKQLATLCRKVWRSNERGDIPYGFTPACKSFDKASGKYRSGRNRSGLTCATFVDELFYSAAIDLLDRESWPIGRPGDILWQQSMIASVRSEGAAEQHVQAMHRDVGNPRFRPEEVGACTAISEQRHPVPFEDATELGQQLLELMQRDGIAEASH